MHDSAAARGHENLDSILLPPMLRQRQDVCPSVTDDNSVTDDTHFFVVNGLGKRCQSTHLALHQRHS
jgi:hypothetical protein